MNNNRVQHLIVQISFTHRLLHLRKPEFMYSYSHKHHVAITVFINKTQKLKMKINKLEITIYF